MLDECFVADCHRAESPPRSTGFGERVVTIEAKVQHNVQYKALRDGGIFHEAILDESPAMAATCPETLPTASPYSELDPPVRSPVNGYDVACAKYPNPSFENRCRLPICAFDVQLLKFRIKGRPLESELRRCASRAADDSPCVLKYSNNMPAFSPVESVIMDWLQLCHGRQ